MWVDGAERDQAADEEAGPVVLVCGWSRGRTLV